MQTLRVSASDIDALRYYLADENGDLDALLRRLRREDPPTEAMMAGTALHTALENSDTGVYSRLEADGYTFDILGSNVIDLPDIREVKAERDCIINNTIVTLVGKVDAVDGMCIADHKFTSRYDAERFLNTYQWRIYLDVFDANEFRWNVFEGRQEGSDPKHYVISNVHQLKMHRYPGMMSDVLAAVSGFVDFARNHLPERFGGAA